MSTGADLGQYFVQKNTIHKNCEDSMGGFKPPNLPSGYASRYDQHTRESRTTS